MRHAAMALGVLKIVNSIDKEDKKLRPAVVNIVSEYDCLFHGIGSTSTPKSRFVLTSLSLQLHK